MKQLVSATLFLLSFKVIANEKQACYQSLSKVNEYKGCVQMAKYQYESCAQIGLGPHCYQRYVHQVEKCGHAEELKNICSHNCATFSHLINGCDTNL